MHIRGNLGVVIGWAITLAGTVRWIYGYFVPGHASLVDWHADTPRWIADYLPNIESEIGMVLAFAGMVPIYWPYNTASRTDRPTEIR